MTYPSGQQKLGKLPNTGGSSIAAAAWTHEGSYLIYGSLRLFLLDQGFPVEYELDRFNTPHTGTTLFHPQNWLCLLWCRIPLRHLALISLLVHIFTRQTCFSPKQPETQTHSDSKVYFLQRQTWLSLHTANILPSHVQQ